ncbi:hypothetical protein HD806DRAFT_532197 [Xylariaceae sp. AK1471]|nr:hypothetical protein HD806DRAFT_532197 [Xylariaceae sp. AK1471]
MGIQSSIRRLFRKQERLFKPTTAENVAPRSPLSPRNAQKANASEPITPQKATTSKPTTVVHRSASKTSPACKESSGTYTTQSSSTQTDATALKLPDKLEDNYNEQKDKNIEDEDEDEDEDDPFTLPLRRSRKELRKLLRRDIPQVQRSVVALEQLRLPESKKALWKSRGGQVEKGYRQALEEERQAVADLERDIGTSGQKASPDRASV